MAKILYMSNEWEEDKVCVLIVPNDESMENPNYRLAMEREIIPYLDDNKTELAMEYQKFIEDLADGNNAHFNGSFFFYESAPMFNGTEDLEY